MDSNRAATVCAIAFLTTETGEYSMWNAAGMSSETVCAGKGGRVRAARCAETLSAELAPLGGQLLPMGPHGLEQVERARHIALDKGPWAID